MSLAADIDGRSPSWRETLSLPLDTIPLRDRIVVRTVAMLASSRIARIDGLEHVLADRDPFILAVNHSTRLEAIVLPAMLMLLRRGRHVHFLADWNFRLVPGVGLLYSCARVITVPNKPARPRILNALKPWLTSDVPPMDEARAKLRAGSSIGIFPEGTVNRDRERLLRGRQGAARLSIETGVPVVAAGLRYPDAPAAGRIPEGSPMEIAFAPAMTPPAGIDAADWHARIMAAIGTRSHKISTSGRGDDDESHQHHA